MILYSKTVILNWKVVVVVARVLLLLSFYKVTFLVDHLLTYGKLFYHSVDKSITKIEQSYANQHTISEI